MRVANNIDINTRMYIQADEARSPGKMRAHSDRGCANNPGTYFQNVASWPIRVRNKTLKGLIRLGPLFMVLQRLDFDASRQLYFGSIPAPASMNLQM
jgi:hypothetical protein